MMLYLTLIEDEADELTFSRIYDLHRNEMIAVAYRVLQDRWDAEDAVQEALTNLAKYIKSVPTQPNELRAYALTAARNAAIRLAVEQKKEREHIHITWDVCSHENIFDAITEKESYENLLDIMRQLPLPYKEVFMLRYVANLSAREIAKVLGRKIVTVNKQLCRGKKLFVTLYKEALSSNG